MLNNTIRLLISILLFLPLGSFAQTLLQKRMSLSVSQQSVKEVLNTLEKQGNFYFSYNSHILDEQRLVSIQAQGKTVEQILQQLFNDQYKYQASAHHIIILPAHQQGIVITGRLIEAGTGLPIEFASIYEKSLAFGTISDAQGHFRLQVKQPQKEYELVISKLSYKDTVLKVNQTVAYNDAIPMVRIQHEMQEFVFTDIQKHWLAKRFINTRDRINAINLRGYFADQKFQFSLLPGMGSKNVMKSQTINKFSFNMLGGYTAGVNGFELGTGFNIVQQNMEYVQIGGLFNIVGGYAKGVQISGVYNYVAKESKGVQFSGIYNNSQILKGVQATGGVNWVRKQVEGIQFSGFGNRSQAVDGLQFSGAINLNAAQCEGGQGAGFVNVSARVEGFQIAGFANVAKHADGVQMAGAVNINRGTQKGTQIAGLLNYAKTIKGVQLGLINVADSSDGLSFGLINIILKGKHSIDISTSDFQPFQVAYKSGNDRLYNIFQVGGNPYTPNKILSIGYGAGFGQLLRSRWQLNHEFTFNTIHVGNWNEQSFLIRYDLQLKRQLFNKAHIYCGPSINYLIHETNNTYEGFKNIYDTPYPSVTISDWSKLWMGWTVGISLF